MWTVKIWGSLGDQNCATANLKRKSSIFIGSKVWAKSHYLSKVQNFAFEKTKNINVSQKVQNMKKIKTNEKVE